jgi:hypothetical protein
VKEEEEVEKEEEKKSLSSKERTILVFSPPPPPPSSPPPPPPTPIPPRIPYPLSHKLVDGDERWGAEPKIPAVALKGVSVNINTFSIDTTLPPLTINLSQDGHHGARTVYGRTVAKGERVF